MRRRAAAVSQFSLIYGHALHVRRPLACGEYLAVRDTKTVSNHVTHPQNCVVHSVLTAKNKLQRSRQTQHAFCVGGDTEGKKASSLRVFASPPGPPPRAPRGRGRPELNTAASRQLRLAAASIEGGSASPSQIRAAPPPPTRIWGGPPWPGALPARRREMREARCSTVAMSAAAADWLPSASVTASARQVLSAGEVERNLLSLVDLEPEENPRLAPLRACLLAAAQAARSSASSNKALMVASPSHRSDIKRRARADLGWIRGRSRRRRRDLWGGEGGGSSSRRRPLRPRIHPRSARARRLMSDL